MSLIICQHMLELVKPPRLHHGDTIGVFSASSPLAGLTPHRVERGIRELERLGFRVVVAKNALNVTGYTAGSPEDRATDIHELIGDRTVKALFSFIGGFSTNQILPFLDFDLIRRNPKIFLGYSDTTVLHFALQTGAGLVSFYGPAVLTQFAENPGLPAYTETMLGKALMGDHPIGATSPSEEWTDEILDWRERKDLERPRTMKVNPGWIWLREGVAEGPLTGGCLSSMMHLRGTAYWPDMSGRILFWELANNTGDLTVGEPPHHIDSHLTDLELSGVFGQVVGMIVGRPFGYSETQSRHLQEIILERTKNYRFPILFGVDIGHTDPMMTIPLGVHARINSRLSEFTILEAGVV